jgi:hypothetical protein
MFSKTSISLSKKRQYFPFIFRRKYFFNHMIGPCSCFLKFGCFPQNDKSLKSKAAKESLLREKNAKFTKIFIDERKTAVMKQDQVPEAVFHPGRKARTKLARLRKILTKRPSLGRAWTVWEHTFVIHM